MGLGKIFEDIKDALTGNANDNEQAQNVDTNADSAYDNEQGILPASQDPYGDPANGGNDGGILPASQDPYGDPADGNDAQAGILPASQDPYGDPADQR